MTTVNPLFVKLCIPTGLEEVLEGLAREVLRRQPENIHSFAAVYFDKLLEIRTEAETRGIDINLQSLIARGKFLEIQEEDLLKISNPKEQILINGEEEVNQPKPEETKLEDLDESETSSTQVNEVQEMQSRMTTAAAVSEPAEIQLIQSPVTENGLEVKDEIEEKGAIQEDNLVKPTLDSQDLESNDMMSMLSEKSSDNSELDDEQEQPEELESQMETTMGLQMDPIDEISEENEMDSLEASNKIVELQRSDAPRVLEMTEIQLNGKPAEFNADGVAEEKLSEIIKENEQIVEEDVPEETKMVEMEGAPEASENTLTEDLKNSTADEEVMEESFQTIADPNIDEGDIETENGQELINGNMQEVQQEPQTPQTNEKEIPEAQALRRQSNGFIILDAKPEQAIKILEAEEIIEDVPTDNFDIRNNQIQEVLDDVTRMEIENQGIIADEVGEKVIEKLSEDNLQEEIGGNEPLNNPDDAAENSADVSLAPKSSTDELDLVDDDNNPENVGKDMFLENRLSEQIESENDANKVDENVTLGNLEEKINENYTEMEKAGLSETIPDETLNEITREYAQEQQTITGEDNVEESSQGVQKDTDGNQFPVESITQRLDNVELVPEILGMDQVGKVVKYNDENDENMLEISSKEDILAEDNVAEERTERVGLLDTENDENVLKKSLKEDMAEEVTDESIQVMDNVEGSEEVVEENIQVMDNIEGSEDNIPEMKQEEAQNETDVQELLVDKSEDTNEDIKIIDQSLANTEYLDNKEMIQTENVENIADGKVDDTEIVAEISDSTEKQTDAISEMQLWDKEQNEADLQESMEKLNKLEEDNFDDKESMAQTLANIEDSAEETTRMMQTDDVSNIRDDNEREEDLAEQVLGNVEKQVDNVQEMQLQEEAQIGTDLQESTEEKPEILNDGNIEDNESIVQSLTNASDSVKETTEIVQTEDITNISDDKESDEDLAEQVLDNVEKLADNVQEMLEEESQNKSDLKESTEEKIEKLQDGNIEDNESITQSLVNAGDLVKETTEIMQTEDITNTSNGKESEEDLAEQVLDNVEKQADNVQEVIQEESQNVSDLQERIEETLKEIKEDNIEDMESIDQFLTHAEDPMDEATIMMQTEDATNIRNGKEGEDDLAEQVFDNMEKQIDNVQDMQLQEEPQNESDIQEDIKEKLIEDSLEETKEIVEQRLGKVEEQTDNISEIKQLEKTQDETDLLTEIENKIEEVNGVNAVDSVNQTTESKQVEYGENIDDANNEEEFLEDRTTQGLETAKQTDNSTERQFQEELQSETGVQESIEEKLEEENVNQSLANAEELAEETEKLIQIEEAVNIEKNEGRMEESIKQNEDLLQEFAKDNKDLSETSTQLLVTNENQTEDFQDKLNDMQNERDPEEFVEEIKTDISNLVTEENQVPVLAEAKSDISENIEDLTGNIRGLNPLVETQEEKYFEAKLEEMNIEETFVNEEREIPEKVTEDFAQPLDNNDKYIDENIKETIENIDVMNSLTDPQEEKNPEKKLEEFIIENNEELLQTSISDEKEIQEKENEDLAQPLNDITELVQINQEDEAKGLLDNQYKLESDETSNAEGMQLENDKTVDISGDNFEDIIADENNQTAIEILDEKVENTLGNEDVNSLTNVNEGKATERIDLYNDVTKDGNTIELQEDEDDKIKSIIMSEKTDDGDDSLERVIDEEISTDARGNDKVEISNENIALNDLENDESRLSEEKFEENAVVSINEIEKQSEDLRSREEEGISEELKLLMQYPIDTSITINSDESEPKVNIDFEVETENNENEKLVEESTNFEIKNTPEDAESMTISVNAPIKNEQTLNIQEKDISDKLVNTEEAFEDSLDNNDKIEQNLNEGNGQLQKTKEENETDSNANTNYLKESNDIFEKKENSLMELDSLEVNKPLEVLSDINQELQNTEESEETNPTGKYQASDDIVALVDEQDVSKDVGGSEEFKDNSIQYPMEEIVTGDLEKIQQEDKNSLDFQPESLISTKEEMDITDSAAMKELVIVEDNMITDENQEKIKAEIISDILAENTDVQKESNFDEEVKTVPNITIAETMEVQGSAADDDILTNDVVAVENEFNNTDLLQKNENVMEPIVDEASTADYLSNGQIDSEFVLEENSNEPGQTNEDMPPTYEEFIISQKSAENGSEMRAVDEIEKMQVQEPEIIKLSEQLEEPNLTELFSKLESKTKAEVEAISENDMSIMDSNQESKQIDTKDILDKDNNVEQALETSNSISGNSEDPQIKLIDGINSDVKVSEDTSEQIITENEINALNLSDENQKVDDFTITEVEKDMDEINKIEDVFDDLTIQQEDKIETETVLETDDETLANDKEITAETEITYVGEDDGMKADVTVERNNQKSTDKSEENLVETIEKAEEIPYELENPTIDLDKTENIVSADLEEISNTDKLDSEQKETTEPTVIEENLIPLNRKIEIPGTAAAIGNDNNDLTITETSLEPEIMQTSEETSMLQEKSTLGEKDENINKSIEEMKETLQTMEQEERFDVESSTEDFPQKNLQEAQLITMSGMEGNEIRTREEQQVETDDSARIAAMAEQPEVDDLVETKVGDELLLEMLQSETSDISEKFNSEVKEFAVQAESKPDNIIEPLTEPDPQQDESGNQDVSNEVVGQLVDVSLGEQIPEGDPSKETKITEVISGVESAPIIESLIPAEDGQQNTSGQLVNGPFEPNDTEEESVQEVSSTKSEENGESKQLEETVKEINMDDQNLTTEANENILKQSDESTESGIEPSKEFINITAKDNVIADESGNSKSVENVEKLGQEIIQEELNPSNTDLVNLEADVTDSVNEKLENSLQISENVDSDAQNNPVISEDIQAELIQNVNPSPTEILYFDVKPEENIVENSTNIVDIPAYESDQSEAINLISETNDQDDDSDVIVGQSLVFTPEEQSSRFRNLIP